jgi:hypothetical protein
MAMKTCVSATDSSVDAQINPRFRRYAYFIIADPDAMEHHSLPNTRSESPPGAGIQAAQIVVTMTLYTNSNLAAYSLFAFQRVVVFDLIVLVPFTKLAHATNRPLALWMNEAATSGQAPADTGCEIE